VSRRTVTVNLGEIRLARSTADELVAFGLGSCVAVCVWDPNGPLAAMAHVVLPRSSNGHGAGSHSPELSGKYADQAIARLVKLLSDAGGAPMQAQWKLVGGAHVLQVPGLPPIGEHNVMALRDALRQHGLRITAEDVGGHAGRTVRLSAADGTLLVRSANGDERVL